MGFSREIYGAQYSESVQIVSKATIDVNGYCEISGCFTQCRRLMMCSEDRMHQLKTREVCRSVLP